ncbi:unnamed protein product [Alopecurus aequalis]
MFLFSIDLGPCYIHNHILHLQNKLRILEGKKMAMLEEQQSLIVAASHLDEKGSKEKSTFSQVWCVEISHVSIVKNGATYRLVERD